MVEGGDYMLFYYFFQGAEVHYHAGACAERRLFGALNGDLQLVGMAVDVVAFARIEWQGMGHFEGELFGEA